MDSNKQISIPVISEDIIHNVDLKTGMHSFTMHKEGFFYQQVLSTETIVYMTPSAMQDYFYCMKKNFEKALYDQNKKPSWMGANHSHYIYDEAFDLDQKTGWKSYVEKSKPKEDDIASLAQELPGMKEVVYCPDKKCKHPEHKMTLYYMIQHVNDEHRWKREDIADWLETLDIDLSFKTPKEKKVVIK